MSVCSEEEEKNFEKENTELIFEKDFFEDIQLSNSNQIKMKPIQLKWDGSDIGAIDENIYDCKQFDNDHVLTLWYQNSKGEFKLSQVKILKYKNEIPIIIDECKPLFGLKKVGKHKAILKDNPIILVRYQGDVSLSRYFKDMGITYKKAGEPFIHELRKIFIFRWFMCLVNNFENIIEVRTGTAMNHPISYKENSFNYDSTSFSTRIPKTIIKKWFNNDELLVDTMITEFIKEKDISILRFEIQKIIMKFDKNLISWNNGIFERFIISKKDDNLHSFKENI